MKDLVLASSSPYRRELLQRLRIPFESMSPDIDEQPQPAESPEALVRRLSLEKAMAVAHRFDNHLIIGSDQIAVNEGKLLTKPGNFDNAFNQLRSESGKKVHFLTGLALLDSTTQHSQVDMVITEVIFRQLSDTEITEYLINDTPYNCAGSFRSEGLGITLFDAVYSSDPTALIGLPLISLNRMLMNTLK
ncbi:MAG: Maf family nucleotide pyrophosphatase [Porticoccus sp.]|jgi:MAF protein|uniref:Maf family protein n=1 Tax=Porticoccus sp. TaxID=2024853 RepID=UPI0032991A9B|tara:strand:+ start:143 stop:712 length:570 start_codon:yes stop_codon:yes gene_type:complete